MNSTLLQECLKDRLKTVFSIPGQKENHTRGVSTRMLNYFCNPNTSRNHRFTEGKLYFEGAEHAGMTNVIDWLEEICKKAGKSSSPLFHYIAHPHAVRQTAFMVKSLGIENFAALLVFRDGELCVDHPSQIEIAKNQEKLIGILPISAWEARALVSTFNAKPSGSNDLIQFRNFFRLFATINKQSLFEIDCGRIQSLGFGSYMFGPSYIPSFLPRSKFISNDRVERWVMSVPEIPKKDHKPPPNVQYRSLRISTPDAVGYVTCANELKETTSVEVQDEDRETTSFGEAWVSARR